MTKDKDKDKDDFMQINLYKSIPIIPFIPPKKPKGKYMFGGTEEGDYPKIKFKAGIINASFLLAAVLTGCYSIINFTFTMLSTSPILLSPIVQTALTMALTLVIFGDYILSGRRRVYRNDLETYFKHLIQYQKDYTIWYSNLSEKQQTHTCNLEDLQKVLVERVEAAHLD